MANFHARSNSFPSQPHPTFEYVEEQLCRLKSSEAASTSASSICSQLDGLRVLHEAINDQIQVSSIQQALSNEQGQKSIDELLEGYLRVVDVCGFSRDIVRLTKESVQDLESSIRRSKGETDVNSYVTSRNQIKKMINKYIKNLKSSNKNSTEVTDSDSALKIIATTFKEAKAQSFSALKAVLILVSGEKERSNQRGWSLLSKLTRTKSVHSEIDQEGDDLCLLNIPKSKKGMDCITLPNTLKQLKASEMTILELEDGLEALFRGLVKTRVSLLNVISH